MGTGRDNGTQRVTIREAANRLGVTEAAIRKRIQRGSLEKEMGNDGRVYVYLDLSQVISQPESQVHHEALVEDLRGQVHYLRSLLKEERDGRRRADMIIAQLTQANAALAQRIPELEAPLAEPTSTQWFAEGRKERPWWRRELGG